MGGAVAAGEAHHVPRPGGGDEVVVLTWLELQGVWHRGEGSEGQSEDPGERQRSVRSQNYVRGPGLG